MVGDRWVINGLAAITIGEPETNASWEYTTDDGLSWHRGQGLSLSASELLEGASSIQVVQVDAAGNRSETASINVVKDTAAQAPFLAISGSDSGVINAAGCVTVTGLEEGASWAFSTDGGTTWRQGQGGSIPASELDEGLNLVQVTQTDAVGNLSPSTSIEVIRDTVAPSAPFVDTGGFNLMVRDTGKVAIQGLEADATWVFSIDGGNHWKTGQGSSLAGSWLNAGLNTVNLVQVDAAGNRSEVTTVEVTMMRLNQGPQVIDDGGVTPDAPLTPPDSPLVADVPPEATLSMYMDSAAASYSPVNPFAVGAVLPV